MRQTLNQSGAALGHVFDDHFPTPVSQEPVERRCLFKVGDGVAHLENATITLGQDMNLIATGVVE